MSVLIKDIEMPTGCSALTLKVWPDGQVEIIDADGEWKTSEAVPITSHGRLIDEDALHKLFEDQWNYLQVLDWNENPTAEAMQSGINWCINTMHDDAPTVIPASKEAE